MVALVVTTLFIGLRYKTGGDWANYEVIYLNYRFVDLWYTLTASDPAYGLLNWSAHRMGLAVWFVNLVCACVFSWGLIQFCRGEPNPWLTCLIAVMCSTLLILAIIDRSSLRGNAT